MTQKIKKKSQIINKLIIILFFITSLVSCNDKEENITNSLAKVNDTEITSTEFADELKFYQNFYIKKYGEEYFNKDSKNLDKLKSDILDSLIKDKVMLNDLKKAKVSVDDNYANSMKTQIQESLGSEDSLKANIKALDISEKEFDDIIFNNSIRRMHYDYFISKAKIKDSRILEYYNKNKDLQRMYKYNVLVFDNKKSADYARKNINESSDFRKYLQKPIKDYDVINSDFVYKEDEYLKLANIYKKDEISNVFKIHGDYCILMLNSYNDNENELLLNAKNIYLKKSYDEYLNTLVKKSKIKVFI